MAEFRVTSINTPVQLTVNNDPGANSGADGDIQNMPLAASGAPERLSERCRIGVVLERNPNVEFMSQRGEEILALPTEQVFDIANEARLRIYRTGASNTDPGDFR